MKGFIPVHLVNVEYNLDEDISFPAYPVVHQARKRPHQEHEIQSLSERSPLKKKDPERGNCYPKLSSQFVSF